MVLFSKRLVHVENNCLAETHFREGKQRQNISKQAIHTKVGFTQRADKHHSAEKTHQDANNLAYDVYGYIPYRISGTQFSNTFLYVPFA